MIDNLTPREKEVLQHLSKAKDRKTVASELGISINTVAAHIRNLHLKTKTRSICELALIGRDHLLEETDNELSEDQVNNLVDEKKLN